MRQRAIAPAFQRTVRGHKKRHPNRIYAHVHKCTQTTHTCAQTTHTCAQTMLAVQAYSLQQIVPTRQAMHKPGSFNAGQRDMKFSYVVLAKGSGHFGKDVLDAVDESGSPAERMDWGRLVKDPMLKKKHLILSGNTPISRIRDALFPESETSYFQSMYPWSSDLIWNESEIEENGWRHRTLQSARLAPHTSPPHSLFGHLRLCLCPKA